MPRFVFWMGLVFAIIGLGVMAGGVLSHRSHQHIIDNGIRTRGVVVDLIRKTDGDGVSTYAPAVEYRDRNRRPRIFRSSTGSSPPAYSRGEEVEIVYLPDRPERALIDDFSGRWFLPVFLLAFGAVFAVVGGGLAYFYIRRRKTIARLKVHGVPASARFVECYRDTSFRINGRNPYKVAAQGTNPVTGKLDTFVSDAMWVDLSQVLEGGVLKVMIDPD